jgi:parvulin-like peptidyl-prolyl isomerase
MRSFGSDPGRSHGAVAMGRLRSLFFLISGLGGAAFLIACSGCSRESRVLARAGKEIITENEFLEVARNAGMQYPGPPDSAKALLLEDLIRRELLLQEAKARQFGHDSLLAAYRHNAENEIVYAAVLARLAPGSIPVSEAEVETLYAWRNTETRARVIYTLDARLARDAMTQIRSGGDFAQLADRYNVPGSIPAGGDLGFLPPGSLPQPLDRELRQAPVGAVIGPLARREGWFILKILERRPQAQPPLDTQRSMLRGLLAQRKQRAVSARLYEGLTAQYQVRVEPGGAQALFAQYQRQSGAPTDPSRSEPQGAAERQRILGRYQDRGREQRYTIADALADLEATGDPPQFNMLPLVERWIESRMMRRVLMIEAQRRHIAEEPAVARRIEGQVNNYLLDRIYDIEVIDLSQVGPEDVQAFYRQRAQAFSRLGSVRLLHTTLQDSAAAQQLIAHGGHAGDLRDAARMISADLAVSDETIAFPTSNPLWGSLHDTFVSLPAGHYAGPIAVPGGWMVFQVVGKQETSSRFEELSPAQQGQLQNDALLWKREQRLSELFESLRRKYPVTIDHKRLKAVRWPEATLGRG